MAFNPFHQFRRYSKAVFAALAILCMFTFVLSSGMGRGDLFSQWSEWAGRGRGSSVYVTLYGKEYDARQFDEVQRQRLLASEYMEYVLGAAQGNLARRVDAGIAKLDPEAANAVREIMQSRGVYLQSGPSMVEFYLTRILQS